MRRKIGQWQRQETKEHRRDVCERDCSFQVQWRARGASLFSPNISLCCPRIGSGDDRPIDKGARSKASFERITNLGQGAVRATWLDAT